MSTFLSNVVNDLIKKGENISEITFILPSKRAGVFLKKELKNNIEKSVVIPKILSIEDFVQNLSSLSLIDNTTLLFEFYTIYKENTKKEELETFDVFSKWATIVLQDFNEIDRHLVDANTIFSYLNDIDRIEKWSLDKVNDTKYVKNYLSFFDKLYLYYNKLNKHLLAKKLAYQGLQYREANENLHNFINSKPKNQFIFAGFNALNKAEELIIKELLAENLATIYWDVDQYYLNEHPASKFIKEYKKWNYFENHPFNWISKNLYEKKSIKIIGAPKNNTQAKYVGEVLDKIHGENPNFENTALVLSDESLLPVTLSSFPESVKQINITMGYDLVNMTISSLLENLFSLHTNSKNKDSFYYKNVVSILNHPLIKLIVNTSKTIDEIFKNNFIYINANRLISLNEDLKKIDFLFCNWKDSANTAIKNCIQLIQILKENIDNKLEQEFLFKNLTVLNQLQSLNNNYKYIVDIKTLHQLFKQVVRNEKLSFQGEPLTGLQLMGVLETRVLDFENIIITSVNEGVLPAGKSDNSFIPFDIKKEFGLPTYQERDAIFSYHFYRLIQRAKNIYLLYNTENDGYGSGEQSRFITELEINKPSDVKKLIVSPKVTSATKNNRQIIKTDAVADKLYELAKKGLSPTSLTSYINNPIDFYTRKILGIREYEEAEETIAANTLGTIIHKTLESFYIPFKGKFLNKKAVINMKNETENEVIKWFQSVYKNGEISTGKNLLIYNVAKQFVLNFLNLELKELEDGKQIKILELEYDLETNIHIENIDFPVKLTGQADRIDEIDGTVRIIDYKTGTVKQNDLIVKDWTLITTDYKKYSKPFQVMQYAYMYTRINGSDLEKNPLESGVISFKNLNAGFLKVNRTLVNKETLTNFEIELKQLITTIFNLDTPFIENEEKHF